MTSFYATFSDATDTYDFSSLREYLLDALKREEPLSADDFTFILTPVTVDAETVYDPYTGTKKSLRQSNRALRAAAGNGSPAP